MSNSYMNLTLNYIFIKQLYLYVHMFASGFSETLCLLNIIKC